MEEELQEVLSLTAWELSYISQALTRAKKLEVLRESFHKELYKGIVFPTAHYDALNPSKVRKAPDDQALRIIKLKERYDKKIMNEYERSIRWTSLLNWAKPSDRIILIRYFQKKKYVGPEIITNLLHRIKDRVEEESVAIEETRTERVKEEYREYLKTHWEKPLRERNQIIYKDGGWVEMTPEEFKEHEQQKKLNREKEEWQQQMERMDRQLAAAQQFILKT